MVRSRREVVRDASVDKLVAAHSHDGPVEDLVDAIVGEWLEFAGDEPPVDPEIVASYLGARVERRSTTEAGSVRWNGDHYLITVRGDDPSVRQRFTLAHEVMHIPFLKAGAGVSRRDVLTDRDEGSSSAEEVLCDLGASKLLMPDTRMAPYRRLRPNVEMAMSIADQFEVSIEAAARRIVALSDQPAALVVLEPKLKPVEARGVKRSRLEPALPGLAGAAPEPRLRVRYAVCSGFPYVPRDKSVDEDCRLSMIGDDEHLTFVGRTGLISEELSVSARLLPVSIDGTMVQRVIAIMTFP